MDPLSALIGAGGSLLGGFMNQSSQQAINTANIQQAQWTAEGGYLPGLIMNANKAGINPLALLPGSHQTGNPVVSGSVGPSVGEAGKFLSQIKDPHTTRMEDAQYQRAQIDIANARQLGNNAAIQGARDMWVQDQLRAWYLMHPDYPPPGAEQPTLTGMGADVLNQLNQNIANVGRGIGSFASRVPQSMWGTP